MSQLIMLYFKVVIPAFLAVRMRCGFVNCVTDVSKYFWNLVWTLNEQ